MTVAEVHLLTIAKPVQPNTFRAFTLTEVMESGRPRPSLLTLDSLDSLGKVWRCVRRTAVDRTAVSEETAWTCVYWLRVFYTVGRLDN